MITVVHRAPGTPPQPLPSPGHAGIRFLQFELRPSEQRLLVDGHPACLGSRALEVLRALAERPGQLVTKEALLDLVWPGALVQENNLPAQVSALRKVIGPQVIATVPGRGYRFTAAVEPVGGSTWPPPAAAPAPPGQAQRTNLPSHLTPLIGRGDDLATLHDLVDRHSTVTVVGPGGMGKSLLTLHLLAQRRERYSHGVCWIGLETVDEAAALPGAIAAALGVYIAGGDALNRLAKALAPLRLLVALDNAEHLLDDVARLAQVLCEAAPGLSLVVTSQAPLRVPGERLLRLAPLAIPAATASAMTARGYEAISLFEDRARAADRHFVLTDVNAQSAIALCQALDGLPLAIELAAARLPVLGLQGLLASLNERLDLLTANTNRWAPVRQQTLRATVEWSYGLLEPGERSVFRRLGVVVGSASLALVERVVAGSVGGVALGSWAVLDSLQVLVERSLVVLVTDGASGGRPRYRLLQSARAFALERLAEAGELAEASRSHAHAVAEHFGRMWPHRWDGSIGIDAWAARLEADLENAREALAWAHAHDDAPTVQAIGVTLLHALPRSQFGERLAVGDTCRAMLLPSLPAEVQLQSWLALSYLWVESHWPRSQAAMQQAIALARAACTDKGADRFWLYLALGCSAALAVRLGDLAAAQAAIAEMRGLEDPRWSPQRLIAGTAAEGVVASNTGAIPLALVHNRRQLALSRAAGTATYPVLVNIMDCEIANGEARAAVDNGAALLAQLQGTRDEYQLAFARLNIVAACLALGDTDSARGHAQAGLRQAGHFDHMPYWADYLSLLAALEGRHGAAAQLAGLSDRRYLDRQSHRLGNETRAFEQACRLAREALGCGAFKQLHAKGGMLLDDDIAPLAFAKSAVRNALAMRTEASPWA